MSSRELSVCAKLHVCARAVPCGRWVVHMCACVCVTETVHVKFSEDCVCMSGYLGGKWEGRCNDTWGSIGSGRLWRAVGCVGG